MAIKLTFEIGHSASRKTKPSKEGFTHDWELFVRSPNESCDIGIFVEKVVFNLHDSFPKPKRVIKEPPYVIKEAGYAGFLLTIDIHLKNRDEPKKATFEYDLDLQPIKVQMNDIFILSPSEDFRRKCLKGGGIQVNSSEYKNRDIYGKSAPMPNVDIKKPSKRPEENKPNKTFTDVFGSPLKKPDPRALQNSSPSPAKLPSSSSSKGTEKVSSSSTTPGSKDKGEKSKHKHSPNKDGKESKKTTDVKPDVEKSKKDKTRDRERSDKKEKVSKRPTSPSPGSVSTSSSSAAARNSTNLNSSLPISKNSEPSKPQAKQSSTPTLSSDAAFKKSSKKDKKSHDKERERNEKKDSRVKEAATSKEKFEPVASKGSSGGVKERDLNASKDDRDKAKVKSTSANVAEPKTISVDQMKKQHEKDSERKHKHKKKEKTKDKEAGRDNKKEKQSKNTTAAPSPAKTKEQLIKYEPPSDSDADSPPSIKQESDNSISDTIMQKPPPEVEKVVKKPPRERTKAADKEDKSRKRKTNKKDERESTASPPPPVKQSRKDLSKSPSIQDRPSSSDSAAHHSHINNNNIDGIANDRKISNEYMSELKDLKQKITTLKNNDDLQQVVKMIAATGCYEITKSSFDFDLVQLDRVTVQRLQEFFANS